MDYFCFSFFFFKKKGMSKRQTASYQEEVLKIKYNKLISILARGNENKTILAFEKDENLST
jgi:hypothetical protein